MYEQALKILNGNNKDIMQRRAVLDRAITLFKEGKVATQSSMSLSAVRDTLIKNIIYRDAFVLDEFAIIKLAYKYYEIQDKHYSISSIILNVKEESPEDFDKLSGKFKLLGESPFNTSGSIYEFMPSTDENGKDVMILNVHTLSFCVPHYYKTLEKVSISTLDVKPTPDSTKQHIEFKNREEMLEFCDKEHAYIFALVDNYRNLKYSIDMSDTELIYKIQYSYPKDFYTYIELGNQNLSLDETLKLSDSTTFGKNGIELLLEIKNKYNIE